MKKYIYKKYKHYKLDHINVPEIRSSFIIRIQRAGPIVHGLTIGQIIGQWASIVGQGQRLPILPSLHSVLGGFDSDRYHCIQQGPTALAGCSF